MRELKIKFKDVDDRYEAVEDINLKGVKIKPFYTWTEKANIFDTMKAQDNEVLRDMALIVKTAEYCTNIDFDGMSDADAYDIVSELRLIGDFKIIIDDYIDMYKLVEREESSYKALSQIIDAINDKLKDLDMTKIQDGFNGLGGVLNGKSV